MHLSRFRLHRVILALLLLAAPAALTGTAHAQAPQVRGGITVGPVTGLPLPRFVSIKPDEANVRVGPGGNYDIQWTFVRAGLPVEITAEFANWRKIRDQEGGEGWIRHDLLSGARMAVVAPWSDGDPLPARRSPAPDAPTRFLLEPGVLARLSQCDGTWCALEAPEGAENGWEGYVRQSAIWGAYPGEVFRD